MEGEKAVREEARAKGHGTLNVYQAAPHHWVCSVCHTSLSAHGTVYGAVLCPMGD